MSLHDLYVELARRTADVIASEELEVYLIETTEMADGSRRFVSHVYATQALLETEYVVISPAPGNRAPSWAQSGEYVEWLVQTKVDDEWIALDASVLS